MTVKRKRLLFRKATLAVRCRPARLKASDLKLNLSGTMVFRPMRHVV
jgi:hypothetical protein